MPSARPPKHMPMGMSTEASALRGVVLAGGRSTRMGTDKALLRWQGRSLLEHQIDVLLAAGVAEVKVSGERPELQGIADPVPQAGPLGGIAGVAAACEDGQLLIVPVDMPRLQAPLLQRLCQAAPEAACVRFAGHVLPMRLRLDVRCREQLAALLRASDPRSRSLRALQEQVGLHEITLSEEEATQLIDCNTPQAWQEVNA